MKLNLVFLFFAASFVLSDKEIRENCKHVDSFWKDKRRDFKERSFQDIIVEKNLIGQGFQGKVYKTDYGKVPIAIKVSYVLNERDIRMPTNELYIYMKLNNFFDKPFMYDCMYVNNSKNQISEVFFMLERVGKNLGSSTSPFKLPDFKIHLKGWISIAEIMMKLAHLGIIHGDLRPQNILYDDKTRAYTLIDYGLSCLEGTKLSVINLETNPPEQNRDIDGVLLHCFRQIDIWQYFTVIADIYLPGRILQLFEGISYESCTEKHMSYLCVDTMRKNFVRYTPFLSERFKNFVLKGLNFDPKDRYQNFMEVIKELNKIYAIETSKGQNKQKENKIPITVIKNDQNFPKTDKKNLTERLPFIEIPVEVINAPYEDKKQKQPFTVIPVKIVNASPDEPKEKTFSSKILIDVQQRTSQYMKVKIKKSEHQPNYFQLKPKVFQMEEVKPQNNDMNYHQKVEKTYTIVPMEIEDRQNEVEIQTLQIQEPNQTLKRRKSKSKSKENLKKIKNDPNVYFQKGEHEKFIDNFFKDRPKRRAKLATAKLWEGVVKDKKV